MKLTVNRMDVWAAEIEDRPGALAARLAILADAGCNLEFVIARREPGRAGGVVFVTPVRGTAQLKAARQAGFQKSSGLHCVRVEGSDRPGIGARITQALAVEHLNLRGVSAAAIGRRFIMHLALDGAGDARKAVRVLRSLG